MDKKGSHTAKNAEHVETDDGTQYHLKVKPGDMSDVVLLPGDPKRVARIIEQWDNPILPIPITPTFEESTPADSIASIAPIPISSLLA